MNAKQETLVKTMQAGRDVNRFALPDSPYLVSEFHYEELKRGAVMVTRKYHPAHAPSVTYSDCYIIGPRLGMKKVYKRIY